MRALFVGASQVGYQCAVALAGCGVELAGVVSLPGTVILPGSKEPVQLRTHADFGKFAAEHRTQLHVCRDPVKDLRATVERIRPDFVFVVGWYHLIPPDILNLPRLGTFGIHMSPLPRYRGGAPLVWQIIHGERSSAASLFRMTQQMDAGDVFGQEWFEILGEDTIQTALVKAQAAACGVVRRVIPELLNGTSRGTKQVEMNATVFPLRRPEDGAFTMNHPAERLYNWIRAQTQPYPGAFTGVRGQKLYVWSARLTTESAGSKVAGEVLQINEKGILVRTADYPRALLILEAGWSSDERLAASSIAKHMNLVPGFRFDAPPGYGRSSLVE